MKCDNSTLCKLVRLLRWLTDTVVKVLVSLLFFISLNVTLVSLGVAILTKTDTGYYYQSMRIFWGSFVVLTISIGCILVLIKVERSNNT